MSKLTPIFRGLVVRGKFVPDFPEGYYGELFRHEGKVVYVTIEKPSKNVTVNQHKYYRGVVLKAVSEVTGYDRKESHIEMAKQFLSYEDEDGTKWVKSTADLTTVEMQEYIEEVCRFCSNHGYHVPSADEVKYE